jgi:hypothetical protein
MEFVNEPVSLLENENCEKSPEQPELTTMTSYILKASELTSENAREYGFVYQHIGGKRTPITPLMEGSRHCISVIYQGEKQDKIGILHTHTPREFDVDEGNYFYDYCRFSQQDAGSAAMNGYDEIMLHCPYNTKSLLLDGPKDLIGWFKAMEVIDKKDDELWIDKNRYFELNERFFDDAKKWYVGLHQYINKIEEKDFVSKIGINDSKFDDAFTHALELAEKEEKRYKFWYNITDKEILQEPVPINEEVSFEIDRGGMTLISENKETGIMYYGYEKDPKIVYVITSPMHIGECWFHYGDYDSYNHSDHMVKVCQNEERNEMLHFSRREFLAETHEFTNIHSSDLGLVTEGDDRLIDAIINGSHPKYIKLDEI